MIIDVVRFDDAVWDADQLAAATIARLHECVKPLEWEDISNICEMHVANMPFGKYYAQYDDQTEAFFASLELGEYEDPIIMTPSDVKTHADAAHWANTPIGDL